MLGSLAAIWISLMLVILLCMCFAISSLISSFTDQDKASVEEHSILQVDLSGEIVEQLSVPTFSDVVNGVKTPTVLGNIIDALAAAKPMIKSTVLSSVAKALPQASLPAKPYVKLSQTSRALANG